MSFDVEAFSRRFNEIFPLLTISCLIAFMIGCRTVSSNRGDNFDTWPLHNISKWFSDRRAGLRQVTALAGISCSGKGTYKSFDAVFSLDYKGEGRIEAMGPWMSPIFCLVFDPNSVYFYLPNEGRLYLGKNHHSHVQILTGFPFDLSLLFNLMSSILPEELSQSHSCAQSKAGLPFLCLEGKDHDMIWAAVIQIRDFPFVEDLTCMADDASSSIRVKYNDTINLDGFHFPRNIHFLWPEGQELHIKIKSARLNSQAPKTAFLPDNSWFRGEVIYLE
ncbi:DUF4292 domain-containing protein [bacterium]|nr:DUF4292 domain-containing protein [bacterium]